MPDTLSLIRGTPISLALTSFSDLTGITVQVALLNANKVRLGIYTVANGGLTPTNAGYVLNMPDTDTIKLTTAGGYLVTEITVNGTLKDASMKPLRVEPNYFLTA